MLMLRYSAPNDLKVVAVVVVVVVVVVVLCHKLLKSVNSEKVCVEKKAVKSRLNLYRVFVPIGCVLGV